MTALVQRCIDVAIRGLPAMFDGENNQFVHSLRRKADGGLQATGHSLRYTAITLLGLQYLPVESQQSILNGKTALEVLGIHLVSIDKVENLGDAALLTWAAAELEHPLLPTALDKLRRALAVRSSVPTIEFSWALSAFVAAHPLHDCNADADECAEKLLRCCNTDTGAFPHRVEARPSSGIRAHIGSYADQVYPIQALARYGDTFASSKATAAANKCADMICRLQGKAGQWWWHYDVRTGAVVEGYPVYTVHQEAMGPMALFDLMEAGGKDHAAAIRLGAQWMASSAEMNNCLIDDQKAVIWRKIARREPNKLSRKLRAVSSRVHKNLRLHWLNIGLRPRVVDYECRPYHLGWILYAWLRN